MGDYNTEEAILGLSAIDPEVAEVYIYGQHLHGNILTKPAP
jgi:hypothetical protein